jgi:hypothetical protein
MWKVQRVGKAQMAGRGILVWWDQGIMANIMFHTILTLEWTRELCQFLMGFGYLCSLLYLNREKRSINMRMNNIFLEE